MDQAGGGGADGVREASRGAPQQAGIMRTVRTSMPKFAVFFSDGAGYGFEMVQALDSDHAVGNLADRLSCRACTGELVSSRHVVA